MGAYGLVEVHRYLRRADEARPYSASPAHHLRVQPPGVFRSGTRNVFFWFFVFRCGHFFTDPCPPNLAVLRDKMKIENILSPLDKPKTQRSPMEDDNPDPPPGPPGGGGAKTKIKNLIKPPQDCLGVLETL